MCIRDSSTIVKPKFLYLAETVASSGHFESGKKETSFLRKTIGPRKVSNQEFCVTFERLSTTIVKSRMAFYRHFRRMELERIRNKTSPFKHKFRWEKMERSVQEKLRKRVLLEEGARVSQRSKEYFSESEGIVIAARRWLKRK